MTRLISFGHGYSARALARRLVPRGWDIAGTTRSTDKADALRAEGVTPLPWDRGAIETGLDGATHLLISTGPTEDGDPTLALMGEALRARADQFSWVGYLSTTGVYGDHGGAWVDESTPLTPGTARGARRVAAEAAWADQGLPLHIFRLAGIYGPGRGPFEKVRQGTARRIIKPGQVFSRIHVADIAQVLEASIARPNPGAVYNVCDDDPAPPQDVLSFAARLLDRPEPPAVDFDTTEMSPMARSFYAESKKVRNARIKTELGVTLRHPDYRSGLRALLAEDATD
ncbi:MAG: SDR family oxidoreductase [Salibaculum sp.]|jgi:nucleoside-diphosphate-sugar epimerase|uniref:SDR family oxidoreductase n=1 Tax=Roseovarius halophilus (ex Wu et al. 2025) TaxID=3376060 RepID=UPI00286FC35B|nr:SDR family oxidoreductase [Salibaculum sp.]MDR9426741.1 SDR family oxidoreductase [Salibaculum sp.]MDR9481297.1 SDR family oxidoreductase [Salibaculum sp.]